MRLATGPSFLKRISSMAAKKKKAAKRNDDRKLSQSRGSGDELHQVLDSASEPLATNQGVRISDNQNSLKANPRGPVLLEDFVLREKITHFDHERIPERIVHARGTAAHGHFEVTHPLKGVTKAAFLQKKGARTPVFVRFSTVAGERGSKDT